MKFDELSLNIVDELGRTLSGICVDQAESLINLILNSKRVFVSGAGRSLLMLRAFAMRLMQFGFLVFVVGDTTTPAIEPEDVLIVGSGSGETATLQIFSNKAKSIGSKLALITIFPDSSIGKLADVIVKIPAPTTKTQIHNDAKSIQPGASLFEQSMLLFLDSIVIRLIEAKQLTANNQLLMKVHANLE